MTTFRAPFNVRQGDLSSEATVMAVEASGSATFAGDLGILGTVSAPTGQFGNNTFAASAITINANTTGAGAKSASASTFFKITLNGSVYWVPVCTSAV